MYTKSNKLNFKTRVKTTKKMGGRLTDFKGEKRKSKFECRMAGCFRNPNCCGTDRNLINCPYKCKSHQCDKRCPR